MGKIYKSRVYRIFFNLLMGMALAGISFFIATIWLEQFLSIVIGTAIFLSYIWLVILNNVLTIVVKDGYLILQKGKKNKQFKIDECTFYAKAITSQGDTSCSLMVTEENGNVEHIDCELIGYGQFQELLMDLGVLGDNAPVNKIQTKKENK